MESLKVMINRLCGNSETVTAVESSIGKTIKRVWLNEDKNELQFEFIDGTGLKMLDDGQSCCEDRYMRTDDDLTEYAGAKLLGFELKDAPNLEDEEGRHEIQFLDVKTDKGTFQMANHNEHNGYYGGFDVIARLF